LERQQTRKINGKELLHSKAWRKFASSGKSREASWTAAVLCRFGMETLSRHLPPDTTRRNLIVILLVCSSGFQFSWLRMKIKGPTYTPKTMAAAVGQALRRAAKDARKTARMYGTPIYFMRNGQIIAEKP
jgi:hypothetical protein